MVGLAIAEASYNGNPLKNAANKKINLKKCFLAKSTLPSNPATELCKPYFRLDLASETLKVSRSRNKIVMPKLLPKNERTNLFLYPEK